MARQWPHRRAFRASTVGWEWGAVGTLGVRTQHPSMVLGAQLYLMSQVAISWSQHCRQDLSFPVDSCGYSPSVRHTHETNPICAPLTSNRRVRKTKPSPLPDSLGEVALGGAVRLARDLVLVKGERR
jgi:hypothetical protein